MIVLNRSHEQIVSSFTWAGDASPSALFELAHTRFENLAQKFFVPRNFSQVVSGTD